MAADMKLTLFYILSLYLHLGACSTVKVSVFYETLCPDSINFITKQLHPNYKAFGANTIDLELIPYGFAKEVVINGTKTFKCQHGPTECYGNKVHGCVINSKLIGITEDFVYCSENETSPASAQTLEHCADEHHIAWADVERCISSGQADNIMSRNGEKTNALHPSSIPSIVFNNIFDKDDSDHAWNDFKGVVCKYLDNSSDQCDSQKDINIILL